MPSFAPDGYINSIVPGWANCSVNVLIMNNGCKLLPNTYHCKQNAELKGKTKDARYSFMLLMEASIATISGEIKKLMKSHFVYIPPGKEYLFNEIREGQSAHFSQSICSNWKAMNSANYFGDALIFPSFLSEDDAFKKFAVLLPDNLSFDYGGNILLTNPGVIYP